MLTNTELEELEKKSKWLRRETIRLAGENHGYHFGGSFSASEILISLYEFILKENDKFILSKGHACFPLYVLLKEKGYSPEICGHPSLDCNNGIFCSTGSLGHGLPMALGMSISKKLKKENGKIFILMGDGECQEGTTWESIAIASHHKLDNIIIIVDYNKIQGSGRVEDILSLGDFKKKFEAFGCAVISINGHSYPEIISALELNYNKPLVIIANTIKGKGVSYMENKSEWHAKFPDEEQLKQAFKELE